MGSTESETASPVPDSTSDGDPSPAGAPDPTVDPTPERHSPIGNPAPHRGRRPGPGRTGRLRGGLVQWPGRFGARPGLGPQTVLFVALTVTIVTMGRLVVWRHDRFGTFDHDLGIWDQGVWLVARGHQFDTVRGLDVFGFHASPGLYLLAPLSWLGAGPNTLNLLMLLVLALGAVPVYRIGRHHLGDPWHALVPAAAFLVHHSVQWNVWETFHPEPLAVTGLLLAYLAALEGRWRAYGLWLVLAMSWKEDIALSAAMLGLVLAVRGRRTVGGWLADRRGEPVAPGPAGTRRAGIITVVAASCWFGLATQILIPAYSPGGNFTENLFGDLGASAPDIASTVLTRPTVVVEHLDASDPVDYGRRLGGAYGFVPLLAPTALLLGLPQAAINLLAVYDFFWTTRFHYVALPLFATTVATVEGLARLRWLPLRRLALGALAAGAFYTAVAWGVSPLSHDYHKGFWPLDPDPSREAALTGAVARPDSDDAVSAVYFLVPHLTHRERIYTFPNPWKPINWGVNGENPPDPSVVEWLIVDPTAIAEDDRATLVAALSTPDDRHEPDPTADGEARRLDLAEPDTVADLVDTDQWRIVTNVPGLLVVRRR